MQLRKVSIAVIGLDGVGPFMLKNILCSYNSRLRSLINGSPIFQQYRCSPPLTPPSWTSIFTGVSCYIHGIVDFFTMHRNNWRPKLVTTRDLKYPRIWEVSKENSEEKGVKLIIGAPFSYPPPIPCKNTVIAGDWTSPFKHTAYSTVSNGRIRDIKFESPTAKDTDEFTRLAEEELLLYRDLIEHVNKRYDVKLLVTVIPHLDWLMHRWPFTFINRSSEARVLVRNIDYIIEAALDLFDIVIICSDHDLIPCILLLNVGGILLKWKLITFQNPILSAFFSLPVPLKEKFLSFWLAKEHNMNIIRYNANQGLGAIRKSIHSSSPAFIRSYPYWVYTKTKSLAYLVKRVLSHELGEYLKPIVNHSAKVPDVLIEIHDKYSKTVALPSMFLPCTSPMIRCDGRVFEHGAYGSIIVHAKKGFLHYIKDIINEIGDIDSNIKVGVLLRKLLGLSEKDILRSRARLTMLRRRVT